MLLAPPTKWQVKAGSIETPYFVDHLKCWRVWWKTTNGKDTMRVSEDFRTQFQALRFVALLKKKEHG
jgi:hypothetical protein